VLAEISTELNWHKSLIKIFVTEKVLNADSNVVDENLNLLIYHKMHQRLLKMGCCSRIRTGSSCSRVVVVNSKYLKVPSSNIGTFETSFSIHLVSIITTEKYSRKRNSKRGCSFFSSTKIE